MLVVIPYIAPHHAEPLDTCAEDAKAIARLELDARALRALREHPHAHRTLERPDALELPGHRPALGNGDACERPAGRAVKDGRLRETGLPGPRRGALWGSIRERSRYLLHRHLPSLAAVSATAPDSRTVRSARESASPPFVITMLASPSVYAPASK